MSLALLLAGKTAPQLLEAYLLKLTLEAAKPGRTFSVTDLDTEGSVTGTLIRLDMEALADLYAYVPVLAAAGYLSSAAAEWLDLLALNRFDEVRKPALFTRGFITLTSDPGFGSYTLQVGDVRVTDSAGYAFINLAGGTVLDGGSLVLPVVAEHPGSAYNLPAGSLTRLVTPLPGVVATNAVNWLTLPGSQAGVDAETDEQLRSRCRVKWAALATGSPRDSYIYWALTANPAVTRVKVRDDLPRGQGTVDVVLAGDGALSPAQVAEVNAYIQARRPVTADVLVYAATQVVSVLAGTVTVPAALLGASQAEGARNIAQLQRSIPIGGKVTRAAIIEALFAPSYGYGFQTGQLGGINVELTQPAADVQLGIADVAVFAVSGVAYVAL